MLLYPEQTIEKDTEIKKLFLYKRRFPFKTNGVVVIQVFLTTTPLVFLRKV